MQSFALLITSPGSCSKRSDELNCASSRVGAPVLDATRWGSLTSASGPTYLSVRKTASADDSS